MTLAQEAAVGRRMVQYLDLRWKGVEAEDALRRVLASARRLNAETRADLKARLEDCESLHQMKLFLQKTGVEE